MGGPAGRLQDKVHFRPHRLLRAAVVRQHSDRLHFGAELQEGEIAEPRRAQKQKQGNDFFEGARRHGGRFHFVLSAGNAHLVPQEVQHHEQLRGVGRKLEPVPDRFDFEHLLELRHLQPAQQNLSHFCEEHVCYCFFKLAALQSNSCDA